MIKKIYCIFIICARVQAIEVSLTSEQFKSVGNLLWQRECNKSVLGLTSWNKGETFPSLGIGHFIWYPSGQAALYKETFPSLISFLHEHKIKIPLWLSQAIKTGCPWSGRESFLADLYSKRMIELRSLLQSTIDLQAQFVVKRFLISRDALMDAVAPEQRQHIAQQFDRMVQTVQGIFALIDYVHFKGEGIQITERYAGKGWGLLQVLEQMHGTSKESAVSDFIKEAKKILQQRVMLSPPEKGEKRWLAGWINRVESYKLQNQIQDHHI